MKRRSAPKRPSGAVAPVASSSGNGSVVKPAEGTFTSGRSPRQYTTCQGIDIAAPIYAVVDGTVNDSDPASGYGNWIRIKHDDGSIYVYGHMSTVAVSVGQQITAGQ